MDEMTHRRPAVIRGRLIAAALLLLSLGGCQFLEKLAGKTHEEPLVPPPPQRKLVADTQAQAAKPVGTPVKLDGSAAGNESAVVPDAPGVGAGQVAAGPSSDGPAPKSAGSATAAGAESAAARDPLATTELEAPAEDGETEGPALPNKIEQVGGLELDGAAKTKSLDGPGADVIEPIEAEGAGAKFQKGFVAAQVNGVPIFAEDVLRALPDELLKQIEQIEKAVAAKEVPPEQLKKYRRQVIEHFLQQHIQQELLLQALKTKVKPEHLTGIIKQLDAQFDSEYLPKVLKDKGYASAHELELELQKQGSSIETIRASFRNKQLAQQYLGSKAMVHDGFDRPDILQYYQDHLDDYAYKAKAKWEQIQVKFSASGGRDGARKKVAEIMKRLNKGEVFAVVAKECSDGSTKSKGGLWGWTTQGSLKSKEIEKALLEQPIGEIGQPIETPDTIEIIRVLDRTGAGHQKFEDVQEDIKNHLKQARFQRSINELLKELTEQANIEKFTDKM
jgi:parvulin-like peptidyl-prolyl isomerase